MPFWDEIYEVFVGELLSFIQFYSEFMSLWNGMNLHAESLVSSYKCRE